MSSDLKPRESKDFGFGGKGDVLIDLLELHLQSLQTQIGDLEADT